MLLVARIGSLALSSSTSSWKQPLISATRRSTINPVSLRIQFIQHASQKPAENAIVDWSSLGLKYPVHVTPQVYIKKTSWTSPPTELPDLPFAVDRTQVGSSLPIYTDYKAGRTKVVTILRKCRGDIQLLKEEMEKVVGRPVDVRPGKLVVVGNFHARLKMWLTGLGF